MACKYYIDNKILTELEVKNYIGENYVNKEDIKLTTLEDIANILAYSNSKLILPSYEVVYISPDNQQFKTYQEASNHISELAKNIKDVDLDNVKLQDKNLNYTKGIQVPLIAFEVKNYTTSKGDIVNVKVYPKINENKEYGWRFKLSNSDEEYRLNSSSQKLAELYNLYSQQESPFIKEFIEKNKEYEQSKEIIEEWKKVNNIQYNPEEIYSRGQEFSSVVGAYSDFDVNLMMQNLLAHIEDNEKAGGKFAISAYTKPIDKQIGHLEGGGGKIKFKIYPKSQDILWAANTDVYSGSVWDASEKVNKDKKSELLGVSYTKYPSLRNVNAVQPNLAAIVDDLSHHHNELAISLNFSNFELEVDEDVPYQTKKIISSINKILDQKRNGKLVKPEINKKVGNKVEYIFGNDTFNTLEEAKKAVDLIADTEANEVLGFDYSDIKKRVIPQGIQPTQTKDNLKESIESIRSEFSTNFGEKYLDTLEVKEYSDYFDDVVIEGFTINNYGNSPILDELISKEPIFNTEKEANNRIKELVIQAEKIYNDRKNNQKEYTSQALINTKIAALKEVAKKYPRSLIRSEVKPQEQIIQSVSYFEGELPFQKIPSTKKENNDLSSSPREQEVKYSFKAVENTLKNINKVNQWYKQLGNTDKFWNKLQQDLQIPKEQIKLLKESEGNNIEDKLISFITNYSYTVEINTAKEDKIRYEDSYSQEGELLGTYPIEEGKTDKPTQYYSNLTVPGGTNGSYIEANIETPMIVPSIQSHAQFKTDSTIGWMRADEKQNYQEKDIDNLIEIMKKSGILEVNCG